MLQMETYKKLALAKITFKQASNITNRSKKNMLPQPIFNFENFKDLDTIVKLKRVQNR